MLNGYTLLWCSRVSHVRRSLANRRGTGRKCPFLARSTRHLQRCTRCPHQDSLRVQYLVEAIDEYLEKMHERYTVVTTEQEFEERLRVEYARKLFHHE